MSRKNDPAFTKMVQDHIKLNEETGVLSLHGVYANLCVNIGWKGKLIVVPYSHIVWLLKHGQWPRAGFHVDHINDDPLDNRPGNLSEITEGENQKKRRGRMVYRSYGKGKYGFGMGVHHDKRDNRYYVDRHLSRGHGTGELKTIRIFIGGFDSIKEAEKKVAECIEEIKLRGLDFVPEGLKHKPKKATVMLDSVTPELRKLRTEGKSIQQISNLTGMRFGAVYSRVKDIDVDCRIGTKPKRVPLRLIK